MIVGVDPGPKVTAAVTIDDARQVLSVHWWEPDLSPLGLRCLVSEIEDRVAVACYTTDLGPLHVYVEDLNAPTPQMGTVAVKSLLGTARIIGALSAMRPTPTLVPPARFGTGPLQAYPRELVGPRERTGGGKSRWQHLRAAYDCALAGATQRRMAS